MVFSAVAMLIFLSALAEGINDAMIRNSVSLFSGHIAGTDIPASVDVNELRVSGVAAVLKRSVAPGLLEKDGRLETLALIAVDPDQEKAVTALWKKTVSGSYLSGRSDEIYVSRIIAEHLAAVPGDRVNFRTNLAAPPVSFILAGTYQTGIDRLDRGLAFCAQTADVPFPGTWQTAVFLRDGYDAADVSRILPAEANARPWSDLMPDLKQLIDLNYVSMSLVTLLVFGVVSIGIACAFAIFILRNLREYGIMKAMGVTPAETMGLIFLEVVLMNTVASLTGMLGGMAAVAAMAGRGIDLGAFTSHNPYFAVSGLIYPRLTVYALLTPPVLAFVFSLLAAVWPAVIVIRKQTASIIRSI
jgi:ABC-type lipoprotein release transport system permease subunit